MDHNGVHKTLLFFSTCRIDCQLLIRMKYQGIGVRFPVAGSLAGLAPSFLLLLALCSSSGKSVGQGPRLILQNGVAKEVEIGKTRIAIDRPVISYEAGNTKYFSGQTSPLSIAFAVPDSGRASLQITFTNTSGDTVHLHNIIPFAPASKDIFISGRGTHRLSRTHLFRPGRQPVNVIVPDNAWELGYSSMNTGAGTQLYGLTRRVDKSWNRATRKRFETILHPGGSVSYQLYVDSFSGNWQHGLRKCFQEKKLYDLIDFDRSLYQRQDLRWIRSAYVMHLMMAWDKDFYDIRTGKFNWKEFSQKGKALYGGDDVICLWPTWPTLGIDQRNQFDLYRDLPGGLKGLRILADSLRKHGTRFFIAYNPWDESTRKEQHLNGLAELIRETSADGVVLDTQGESSAELQATADRVRAGVVMYSEGMAIPKDMQGIVSGRVHNALYYPPMLNLNKLIQPEFSIFRVAEVFKEPILREYSLAFFNGYGTEINQFAPGHPDWEEEQYKYLGRTSMILRESATNFSAPQFIPLIDTSGDSLWVNQWPLQRKTLYTIFSLKPEGFHGPLFQIQPRDGFHWIDLWNHREATMTSVGGKEFVNVTLDPFSKTYLGSNNEGQVGCLAELPKTVTATLNGNKLDLSSTAGNLIKIWAGDPRYDKVPVVLRELKQSISLSEKFGRYEGKIVIQVFEDDELLDESVVHVLPGSARLISKSLKSNGAGSATVGMVKIPAGTFRFKTSHGDAFIPYPTVDGNEVHDIPAFYIDRFPITNEQFNVFLKASNYVPTDTSNFLRHWRAGKIVKGEENYPVVYVSYEDALAYSIWAGKRLPTEMEWQYAAQTDKQNEWPWKQTKPVSRKERFVTETLTVTAIEGINPKYCNLGDGKPYPVGKYAAGANPWGLQDLVGSVWQLTNDVYESGSYRYIMMKGGSYFKPSSSWWYVQGGPRELHYRQYLLRVSQGFERNATVGFRCVLDGK